MRAAELNMAGLGLPMGIGVAGMHAPVNPVRQVAGEHNFVTLLAAKYLEECVAHHRPISFTTAKQPQKPQKLFHLG
jgi:hypothetical protein